MLNGRQSFVVCKSKKKKEKSQKKEKKRNGWRCHGVVGMNGELFCRTSWMDGPFPRTHHSIPDGAARMYDAVMTITFPLSLCTTTTDDGKVQQFHQTQICSLLLKDDHTPGQCDPQLTP